MKPSETMRALRELSPEMRNTIILARAMGGKPARIAREFCVDLAVVNAVISGALAQQDERR
jgi:hypothetical protein